MDLASAFTGGGIIGCVIGSGMVGSIRLVSIKRAVAAAVEAQRQSNFWEGQYRARSVQFDDLTKVNANLHEGLRNANKTCGDQAIEIAELEQKLAVTTGRLEAMARVADGQRKTILSQGDELNRANSVADQRLVNIQLLEKALAEASKNDKRDAKGRFIKAIETSLAQESL